jgi:hypothetical protein
MPCSTPSRRWRCRFVAVQIGMRMEAGWPTDGRASCRAVDVRADEAIRIPGIRWSRQQILFSVPAEKLRTGRDSCVAHELTHLLAPGIRQPDRTLAKGLAVHLQALFDVETGDPLRDAETKRERADFGAERQLAYLQEGAFVRFLIERHDLATDLRVHNGERCVPVFGCDLDALEERWVAFLG